MSEPLTLGDKVRIVRQQVGMLGAGLATRYLLLNLLHYNPGDDASFDRRYGTDTGGLLRPKDWHGADEVTRAQGVGYVPSPARLTRYMLRSLHINPAEFTFVDVGCGKGRVLLVASSFRFRRVIGIELSPRLCEIAEKNLALFRSHRQRCRELEIQCAEATGWPLPEGDLVLHLYHPFGADVLRRYLAHVGASLDASTRRIALLYLWAGPEVAGVFAEFPVFQLIQRAECWNPRYSWAHYSNSPPP